MIEYVLLFTGKFFVYLLVCAKAPKFLAVAPTHRLAFASAWSGLRLLLGFLTSYPILWALIKANGLGLRTELVYFVVLLAVRSALWSLVVTLILRRHRPQAAPRVRDWVFLGVCASFAIDAIAWASGANFKLFC